MIFHQIQLMACATLARRYARAPAPGAEPGAARERETSPAQMRFVAAASEARSS
jgi:hypothetical protein